jgi:hypothetical protein
VPALLAIALIAIGVSPALAGELARVGWLGAVIEYDPGVWRASAPSREADLTFTCIARECESRPVVYAYAMRLPENGSPEHTPFCASDRESYNDRQVLQPGNGESAGRIAFVATSTWSGCRALDAPILAACAEHEGTGYRFATTIASGGCNFEPELPAQRFIELLNGVRPAQR